MYKISVGRRRKNTYEAAERNHFSRAGELLTTAGIGTMAAILIAAMYPSATGETDSGYTMPEAVAVMSTGVSEKSVNSETREELVMPEKSTSAAGEESVFEVIGEFFASMIFGES